MTLVRLNVERSIPETDEFKSSDEFNLGAKHTSIEIETVNDGTLTHYRFELGDQLVAAERPATEAERALAAELDDVEQRHRPRGFDQEQADWMLRELGPGPGRDR